MATNIFLGKPPKYIEDWYKSHSTKRETIVTYTDSSTQQLLIEGRLTQSSIPNRTNAAKVEIGSVVTSIGPAAFFYCNSLTSVTIPDSVMSIEKSAFFGCSSLTSMTIPDSVTSIDQFAFQYCNGLMSFTVGSGNANYKSVNGLLLSKDGKTLIAGVNGNVTIPNSVTNIDNYAFRGCRGLTNVMITDSVTSIGMSVFQDCQGLTNVTIPVSVTSIGNQAFCDCTNITSMTIPDNVTGIGYQAFSGTDNCYEMYFPGKSVEYILENAVYLGIGTNSDNSLRMVIVYCGPDGTDVVVINGNDGSSSSDDNSQTYVRYSDGTEQMLSISGELSKGFIPNFPNVVEVKIGSAVTSISMSAFEYCNKLMSVTIPDSVTSIGDGAFYNCSSLTNVMIGTGVTSIKDSTFNSCSRLTSVTIPNSVTSIERMAFLYCSGLTSVTIPDSVTSIGQQAFSGCSGLTSVTITANGGNAENVKQMMINAGVPSDIEWNIDS